jgi:hypothetical protein
MKTIQISEVDSNEGFTVRVLLGMGPALAEMLNSAQTAVTQYNALAATYGIPACPNPPAE